MALTLAPADLQYPTGELQAALFPDGDIEVALSAWLNEARNLTSSNEAAAHYVYYRGYNAAANRIAALPSSQSTGQGSHSEAWSDGRIDQWRALARAHKAAFDAIVPPLIPLDSVGGYTGPVSTVATW
jgi:hypothetical protein